MAVFKIDQVYPIFIDTNGNPIDNGKLYVGVAGQNAETNPITVYSNIELTIPVPNPLTINNGYIYSAGTPVNIFAATDYSIVVKNAQNEIVFVKLSNLDVTSSLELDTLNDLRNISYPVNTVWISGYYTKNDGAFGSNIFRLKGIKTTEIDNNGTIIIVTIDGTDYAYEFQYNGAVNVKWFGTKGDGATDDSLNLQNAINYCISTIKNLQISKGNYIVNNILTITSGSLTIIADNEAIIKRTIPSTGGASSILIFDFTGSDSNIMIDGLTIDGGRGVIPDEYTSIGTFGTLEAVATYNAINWIRCNSVDKVIIKNCTFKNIHGNIALNAQNCNDVTIENNSFINCSASAFKTVGCNKVNVDKNYTNEIGILPTSFLVDGVNKTFATSNYSMSIADAYFSDGTGYSIVTNNRFDNVSRCNIVGDTSTIGQFAKMIIAGNICINNHERLRNTNPHGAIWVENVDSAIIDNNIIKQLNRSQDDLAIASIVVAGADNATEHYTITNNEVVHNFRTASGFSDKIMRVPAPEQGSNCSVIVEGNIFKNLDTTSGSIIIEIESTTTKAGHLHIENNILQNKASYSGSKVIQFTAGVANEQFFKNVIIANNSIMSNNNTIGFQPDVNSCISFSEIADYEDMTIKIHNNIFDVDNKNALYLTNFKGDSIDIRGNTLFAMKIWADTARQINISNNEIETSSLTFSSIKSAGAVCTILNNTIKSRLRIEDGSSNVTFSNNDCYCDVDDTACILMPKGASDISILNNSFTATANNQELLRHTAGSDGSSTSIRDSIIGNLFNGKAFTGVIGINYQGSTAFISSQIVADNRFRNAPEGGTNAPRNTNV